MIYSSPTMSPIILFYIFEAYWLTDHTIFINSILLNNLKSIILFMQVTHIEIKDKFTYIFDIGNYDL